MISTEEIILPIKIIVFVKKKKFKLVIKLKKWVEFENIVNTKIVEILSKTYKR